MSETKLIPSLNLHRNNSISDAFKAIKGRFGMVVIIIDGEGHLCGIVSEGDLRRAILAGDSLNTPLEKVMNSKPVVLNLNDLDNEVKCTNVVSQIYLRYGTGQGQQVAIPVIDANRNVVGLATCEMLQLGTKDNVRQEHRKSISPQVLVIGGAGYIGSVVTRMLLAFGWRVRVLDNMLYMQTSLDEIKDERLSVLRGDVTDINAVVEAIEGIDAIVYLAEIVGDAACAHRPERALKTNYLSVANITHLCAYLNISRFIYASSCSVYGGNKELDRYLTEESELNPVSHYGRMKIMAEQVILGISNSLFAPTILRFATVFGYSYRPRFDLIVNTFAKNAFFAKSIEVFGGNQWRPNVHVTDAARAIIKVLEAPIDKVSRQIFNVGSRKENYTINELAQLTSQVFPEIEIKQNNKLQDLRNYRVDSGKIEEKLGYRSKMSVLDGLREFRTVFEKGEIKNPDEPRYSNIKAMQEFVCG